MSATAATIETVETAFAATISSVDGLKKVYTEEPGDLEVLPCLVMWPPEFDRGEPDTQEAPPVPLGRYALWLWWDAALYLRLDTGSRRDVQRTAKRIVGAMIGTVDDNHHLGLASVIEARIVSGECVVISPDSGVIGPELLVYQLRVGVMLST